MIQDTPLAAEYHHKLETQESERVGDRRAREKGKGRRKKKGNERSPERERHTCTQEIFVFLLFSPQRGPKKIIPHS